MDVQTLDAVVQDLTHEGHGVVKVDQKVYFVDGVLPGEKISFSPERKRKGKLPGKLDRVHVPSADRVPPQCEYFGVCGGCALQHIDPHAQLKFKQKVLLDNLERIGHVTPEKVLDPVQGSLWHYRRKARLGVKFVPKKGGILVGFRERNSSFITSLKYCKTLDLGISGMLPGLHDVISDLSHNNRIPQVEVAAGDNGIDMVFRHLEEASEKDKAVLSDYALKNNINLYLQPKGLESIYPLSPASPDPLHYNLEEYDLKLEFSATDFIQVNAEMNQRMVSNALEFLELTQTDKVLDLFCGLGNFTLPIARSGCNVVGIEGETRLVEKGYANAKLNGIGNVEFLKMDLFQDALSPQILKGDFNKVLLDPPRSGAWNMVARVIPSLRPEIVVYVSCNPATLARDSDQMVNSNGYTLTAAGAINMFPHTAHIESIAVFKRD